MNTPAKAAADSTPVSSPRNDTGSPVHTLDRPSPTAQPVDQGLDRVHHREGRHASTIPRNVPQSTGTKMISNADEPIGIPPRDLVRSWSSATGLKASGVPIGRVRLRNNPDFLAVAFLGRSRHAA